MIDNKIYVFSNENKSVLKFPKCNINVEAYIGKNGLTSEKKEGDGKTPLGEFELGVVLGFYSKEIINKKNYMQINDNMYWVDDPKSKYYNKLIDITKVQKDWNSAEHLIDYPIQYEYLIEVKTNPQNVPGNGSAIFLHCTNNKATQGCVAVDREVMRKIIDSIDEWTTIEIVENL